MPATTGNYSHQTAIDGCGNVRRGFTRMFKQKFAKLQPVAMNDVTQARRNLRILWELNTMEILIILLLILVLFGGGGYYGYRSGYYGGPHYGGGMGIVILLIVLFLVFGGGYHNLFY